MRSVGASGAGHSPWSEPVAVTMPGRAEAPPPAPASTASEASEAPKRRRKKGGHERELEQADPKRSEWPTPVHAMCERGLHPANLKTREQRFTALLLCAGTQLCGVCTCS